MATIELPNQYMEIQWVDHEQQQHLTRGYRNDLLPRVAELEAEGIKVTWFELEKDNLELIKERAERYRA